MQGYILQSISLDVSLRFPLLIIRTVIGILNDVLTSDLVQFICDCTNVKMTANNLNPFLKLHEWSLIKIDCCSESKHFFPSIPTWCRYTRLYARLFPYSPTYKYRCRLRCLLSRVLTNLNRPLPPSENTQNSHKYLKCWLGEYEAIIEV